MCSNEDHDSYAVDEVMDFISIISQNKDFENLNEFLVQVDLSKLTTGVLYCIVWQVCSYINQLPEYRNFYSRVREEYARRNRSEQDIKSLFDKLRDGGPHLYDPNAPKYIPPHVKDKIRMEEALQRAIDSGDKDLANYITWYMADRESRISRDNEFHKLRHQLGDEELRKRAIKSLRGIADILERSAGSYPGIYYCTLSKWVEGKDKKDIMDGVTVVLSYPWGG